MNRAVFLDRDGVINELIYYREHGIIDSPFAPEQFKLLPGVGEAINELHTMGYKVIVTSNQPGVAKGHFSEETLKRISQKMKRQLSQEEAFLDGEYYCFHHPEAKLASLRVNCDCRKPKPGLLLQAARELNIDLPQSWMVGDGLTDIQAGKAAGCKTVLIGRMKCELCHLMDDMNARPDFIATNLPEAVQKIAGIHKSGSSGETQPESGIEASDVRYRT